jgi:dissimilatory sulfite reductase (desulfoviridin) alpha/beta subunit
MVAEYVQGIMQKGIRNFAKQLKRPNDEVQLLISWNAEEGRPRFRKMVVDTFNDVLGVKFDMFNREEMVRTFITKTMQTYSEELECYKEQLFIVIALLEDAEGIDQLKLHLFKGNERIKELQLEQLLT